MKILFVYSHQYPEIWKDGLWAALNLLEKDGFEIHKYNLNPKFKEYLPQPINPDDWFMLGWGGFNSPADKYIQEYDGMKRGLCIAGNAFPPKGEDNYDVLFYETEFYLPFIQRHRNVVHAFGINSDIYKPIEDAVKIWDWISVGSFSLWKRQHLLKEKGGYKLAIGEIQKENLTESMSIIADLLSNGIAVSDMVEPETLAKIYNSAEKVYISSNINGGGERAVLEARACNIPVFVENDNFKLQELLIWKERGRVPDHYFYFDALKRGILSCFP